MGPTKLTVGDMKGKSSVVVSNDLGITLGQNFFLAISLLMRNVGRYDELTVDSFGRG